MTKAMSHKLKDFSLPHSIEINSITSQSVHSYITLRIKILHGIKLITILTGGVTARKVSTQHIL